MYDRVIYYLTTDLDLTERFRPIVAARRAFTDVVENAARLGVPISSRRRNWLWDSLSPSIWGARSAARSPDPERILSSSYIGYRQVSYETERAWKRPTSESRPMRTEEASDRISPVNIRVTEFGYRVRKFSYPTHHLYPSFLAVAMRRRGHR